ncbi:DUF4236 domain-containing protein [Flavobacterium piscis]|uniref:DUF4236 domain-containing protein n=1 Tax=Flavobacterium piscis TaxID=1114874 RepID=A0ABU1YEI7_9FLAO|nr:DUF4236 domain-containing protein [Flavobacterium piscis]MDR7212659.1 hypothetical protein [Flavobacterium piscis]
MGFQFQKRIKLGSGLGLNISKSGISPSLRTRRGTISSRGFSIKTGTSGVNYQNNFSNTKNSGCMLLFAFTGIISFLIYTINQY